MRPVGFLLAALLAAALLSACGASAPEPTLEVQVQVEGNDATATAVTTGLKLGVAHHVHFRLNTPAREGPEIMDDDGVYTWKSLDPGTYTVVVDIAGHDHRSIGLTRQVEFTVP